MKFRRYYDPKKEYDRYIFPELNQFDEYLTAMTAKGYSQEDAVNIDNAEYEILLDEEEQANWFFDSIDRVLQNPRWYLDNLDYIPTFVVDIKKIFPEPVPGPGLLTKEPDSVTGKRGNARKK